MRACIWLIPISLLVIGGCSDDPKLVAREPEPVPVEVRPAGVSFGDVPVGDRLLRKIDVRAGSRPVTLSIEASDLPTSFEVASLDLYLEAFQEVSVEVAFLPAERGPAEGSIGFHSEAGLEATVRLDGRGVTPGNQRITLEGDLAFGDVLVGQNATLPVEFESGFDEPIEVKIRGGNQEDFQVETDRFDLQPGERRTVSVTFGPRARGSSVTTFWVEACRECDVLTIQATGRGVIQSLRASPTRISFQRTPLGSDLVRTQAVTLTNVGDVGVEVGDIWAAGDGFSVLPGGLPLRLGPGDRAEIEASFSPIVTGTSRGAILVDDPHGMTLLEVPLTGSAGGSLLRVVPEALDFGEIPKNSSSVLTVDLENVGGPGDVSLLEVKIRGSDAASFDAVIPAGSPIDPFVRVPVRFTPNREGEFLAELVLRTDAPDQTEMLVPLSGAGVESNLPEPFEPVDICHFRYFAHPPTNWDGLLPLDAERLEIVNDGPDDCLLWDFRMSIPGTFYVIDAPPGVTRLAPGQSMMVEYGLTSAVRPHTYYLGNLLFETQAGTFHFLWIGLWSR